jgi:exonuclease SbcD
MTTHQNISAKPAGTYRLLHTADWHLGKMLKDQSRDAEHALFLDWLLKVVKEHEIDTILLAGDVFDSTNPPQSALGRYYDFVSALFRQGNCGMAIISGNHDSPAQLEAPKQALHALNVHVTGFLADDPQQRILLLPDAGKPRLAIAMLPFLRDRDLRVGKAGEGADEIRSQIAAGIKDRYEEAAKAAEHLPYPVIATGHLTVLGASPSDSERDIHIGGLGAVTSDIFPTAFVYVALGHLHRPQATDGAGRVRYAGSPIALSFSEAEDAKEVRILDVTDAGLEHYGMPIPIFRKLAQIRTTQAGLERALGTVDLVRGDLRPWLEVIVEDAALEEDLLERVRSLSAGKSFDVLKVSRGALTPISGMVAGKATDDEAIESLLEQPTRVFGHLLSELTTLNEAEIQSLQTAFALLVDLVEHSETAVLP